MGTKNDLTRKEFITLTFTLIGATAAGACSDDNDNNNNNTGFGGHGGGNAGTTGRAGSGGSGGGHGGAAGTSAGGTGGTGTAACADPLPEVQVADTTGHTHTVTIHPSVLDMTTAQTITTSSALTGAEAHTHTVTLEPAQLAALKSGGSATVMSSINMSHGHMYAITCN